MKAEPPSNLKISPQMDRRENGSKLFSIEKETAMGYFNSQPIFQNNGYHL